MFVGGNAMEIKTEVNSNNITECSDDDHPTAGMFCCFMMMHSLQSFACVLNISLLIGIM